MGQGKLVAPSDAPRASPREKEPCMRLERAWEMVQRIPCSFKKRMKMTQGKDWWSQGRTC